MIGLAQMRLWRKEPSRPFGVVGEQYQSFAGFVQASDGRQMREILAEIVEHRLPPFFVGGSCHHTTRFVEYKVDL